MVSVQEAGKLRFYRRRPNGQKDIVYQGDVKALAPKGGAADAAASSLMSPDAMLFAPVNHAVVFENDDILEVGFTPIGADGLDVSDSVWMIPLTTRGAGVKHLSQSDFKNPAPADYTTVADIEVIVGGYKITEGSSKFGGSVIYCDIQDDTA